MSKYFTDEKFLKFEIPVHSDEWYDFRTIGTNDYPGGIGASESAKTLTNNRFRDRYRPSLPELFQQKIGMWPIQKFDNLAMVRGRIEEPRVAELWKHWTGDAFETWLSFEKGEETQRECEVLPFYLVNQDYPWLFASWDRGIPPGQVTEDGEILRKICPLEIKTISVNNANQYKSRIPPKYIVQLHQQMIVGDCDYGELFVKEDDGKLALHRYDRDLDLCNLIVSKTKEFWNRVEKARPMYQDYVVAQTAGREDLCENIMAEIMALEPEVDGSEAYKEFMLERYQTTPEVITGGIDVLSDSVQALKIRRVIKDLEERRDYLDNKIRDAIAKKGVEELHFPEDGGKVVLKTSGKSKRLTVKPNIEVDQVAIEAFVDELIQGSKLF